jgi:hypothetical protein
VSDLNRKPARTLPCGPHALGVLDCESHRAFHVNVLAGSERVYKLRGVQMRRCRNQNRIDCGIVQEVPVVEPAPRAGSNSPSLIKALLINIRDSQALGSGASQRLSE